MGKQNPRVPVLVLFFLYDKRARAENVFNGVSFGVKVGLAKICADISGDLICINIKCKGDGN